MIHTINTAISVSSIKTCVLVMKIQCVCSNIRIEVVLGFIFWFRKPCHGFSSRRPRFDPRVHVRFLVDRVALAVPSIV